VALWPEGELSTQLQQWDQCPIARIALQANGAKDPLLAQILQRHTPKTDFYTSKTVDAAALQQLLKTTETSTGIGAGKRHKSSYLHHALQSPAKTCFGNAKTTFGKIYQGVT
jgi:hypothetical protein